MTLARPFFLSSCLLGIAYFSVCSASEAATVTISPVKDNTIFSELGNNSNGGGGLFVGKTGPSGGIRRTLVQFDILGNLPAGAVIDSVSVSFVQTKVGGSSVSGDFELHKLTKIWGEGTAAGIGQGAASGTGDATWVSSANGITSWTTAGGDFGATSGSTNFSSSLTTYTFASSAGLVADVQSWLNSPATNFGWLLRAADEGIQTARELGSREGPANQRPSLVINYTVVPEPASIGLLGSLIALGCVSRRRKI